MENSGIERKFGTFSEKSKTSKHRNSTSHCFFLSHVPMSCLLGKAIVIKLHLFVAVEAVG